MASVYECIKTAGCCRGQIVVSDAGHDKGKVYLVMEVDEKIAYLSDGRTRKADNRKKKRVTHLIVLGAVGTVNDIIDRIEAADKTETKDMLIREAIKEFMKDNEDRIRKGTEE